MSAQTNPQRIPLANTSLVEREYRLERTYIDPEIVAGLQVFNPGKPTTYYLEVSPAQYTQPGPWVPVGITTVYSARVIKTNVEGNIRDLSERLCEVHPAISTYQGIFGGIPHLKGLRISVADILEQLYLTGSIDAVREIYSPDVSEDQIKEAIAYAQDFLESAISS